MIELSTDQTIEKVLQSGYYLVPRFQRPYSWTAENYGEFWSDTVQGDTPDYFIGAFIVYELQSEDSRGPTDYAIVDGQQRLTTITVLLAAIRDALASEGESELALGIQSYIMRPDRRNRPRFVLETEGGFPFFQGEVQSFPPAETDRLPPRRPDERLLRNAYDYFRNQLDELRAATMRDPRRAREDRRSAVIEQLEEIRDKILNLVVIFVVVDDEDDAYIIFETLNTRGKDLSTADLVRNFLLRDLRESTDAVDLPRRRFNTILETLQDPSTNIDPSEFLLHSWLSRQSYVSGKDLFREIKRCVRTRAQKVQLLSDFETDLPLYVRIRRPDRGGWTNQQGDLVRSLNALSTFGMKQPLPLILSALRAYETEGTIRIRALRRLMKALEVFHYKFTAIAGRSSSGGISRRYAMHARQLVGADSQAVVASIDDLIDKLQQSLPSRDEFLAGFAELSYSSTKTRLKPLVKYTLEVLYRTSAGDGVTVNFDEMTIEHLAPENASATADEAEEALVASIGNLILVSEVLNNRLSNKTFERKKAILAGQQEVYVDPSILDANSWGDDEIRARSRSLGETAHDRAWVL